MKTFNDYVNLQELAAYDVGASVLGRVSLDADSETALTAAMQAFEIIMAKNSSVAVQFLNRMSQTNPEIKAILQQHGLDSFRDSDFKNSMRKGAGKGRNFIKKGLGDTLASDDDNVISSNIPDSPGSENY